MIKSIKSLYADFKRRKARGDTMRPIWQIAFLLPLFFIYWPAQKYVDWMDETF